MDQPLAASCARRRACMQLPQSLWCFESLKLPSSGCVENLHDAERKDGNCGGLFSPWGLETPDAGEGHHN